ncbi:MAG: nucleotide exchange factor GrpE [Bacteroidetes bacterium]|nr:MAG: nucleotide exchange factor GrpE [Bacteroidota bacterium]
MEILSYENEQRLLPSGDVGVENERLRENLQKAYDQNLRILADFQNYRTRVERDRNKLAEDGKREFFLPLLEIIDDMEKALEWTSNEDTPLVQGVRIIHHKFLVLLKTHSIHPFESVGMSFSHDLHEAVEMAKQDSILPGTIVDELRRGYLWKNKLLRAAQVRVAG